MGHEFSFQIIQIEEAIAALTAQKVYKDVSVPTVLIVDDEPLIVQSLAAILSRNGFSTLSAHNGADALRIARETAPDLLITDVAMPGMDGVELAIRLVAEIASCKVLLFSAHASTLDLTPARSAGHDFPLLAKPVHPKQMLARVMECFQTEVALAN